MKIKKADFLLAGFSTRLLPEAKTMPIVDKPINLYAAEEAIASGIGNQIFLTGHNKRAIEDHSDGQNELVIYRPAKGKGAQANLPHNIIHDGVECIFASQVETLGLGRTSCWQSRLTYRRSRAPSKMCDKLDSGSIVGH